MLADNIVYLKKNNPALYEALIKIDQDLVNKSVIIEETKNKNYSIKVNLNGKENYLSSKYDPVREAEFIIDKFEEQNENLDDKHVIFYGIGLGYHIEVFTKRHPQIDFTIYEPSIEIFLVYLSQNKLSRYSLKRLKGLYVENKAEVINEFISDQIENLVKEVAICVLPSYQTIFAEKFEKFFYEIQNSIKVKRTSLHTDIAFKVRWILNSVVNFREVLKTPNIIMCDREVFKGKTAILVSAGPSLDFEINNLKLIKEKKMACIFTVGSAINTLLHYGLYPDAMCTYDPSKRNQVVFKKLQEMDISSIPMIFGTSAVFETLQNYNGPKYHMITSQDTVSDYFLRASNGKEIPTISDAPSIAVVTLELLHKLKFDQIVLVGQNLAYLEKKNYAEGIEYQKNRKDINESEYRTVQDVTGKDIFTTDSFLSMKRMMESHIQRYEMKVVNTTIGGAKIEGTKFFTLEDVIRMNLNENAVLDNEFQEINETKIYDENYLKSQFIKIKREFEKYKVILMNIKGLLIKTEDLIKNNNEKQASNMYNKLDRLIAVLEENDFCKVFVLPMHRVEHQLLARNVQRLKKEKNKLNKIQESVFYLNAFIERLLKDKVLNQQIIQILEDLILNLDSLESNKN